MKKRKPRVVYGIEDCQWKTIRGVYATMAELREVLTCKYCKIIRFIEADRKG